MGPGISSPLLLAIAKPGVLIPPLVDAGGSLPIPLAFTINHKHLQVFA